MSTFQNIWLADDDIDDIEIFTEVLSEILPLAKLTIHKSGDQLLHSLSPANKPDMLFLDINMPCKDGLKCLEQIRARAEFKKLPIIMFTSSSQPKHLESAYKSGATLYYTKPSSFNQLIEGLESLFNMNWDDPSTITNSHYLNNGYVAYNFSKDKE